MVLSAFTAQSMRLCRLYGNTRTDKHRAFWQMRRICARSSSLGFSSIAADACRGIVDTMPGRPRKLPRRKQLPFSFFTSSFYDCRRNPSCL